MEFRLGNFINAYEAGDPVNGNYLHLNYYSHGNVMLGTNQDTTPDPIPTISVNKFSSNTGNAFEVQGNSVFSGNITTNQLNITEQLIMNSGLENGFNIFEIRNTHPVVNNPMIRFRVGELGGESIVCQMTNDGMIVSRNLNMGTAYKIQTSIIDTATDTNLLIKRSGTDVINIFTTPVNGPSIIIDAQTDCGFSSNWVFGNTFANRSSNSNTVFRGAIDGGLASGKIYMTYFYTTETLDFDCVIDNTGRNVIGNLINTAVSDKNLKTNIQDIDANYSDCVKNVKLKTFEFKDEKKHNQDKYGMIAQDLLEHLPKEFKNIVRENKPKKDGDREFLSIDYMKLSVVLWGCCQEQQSKIEHLEASVYEMMEDLKELKGKKTTKPKAKAKSKAKAEQ